MSPRQAPSRFFTDAPEIVRRSILVIHRITPAAPLDFDILLRPDTDSPEIVGLDFGKYGARGCHFFLSPEECRGYRERNRRKRIAWADLPEPTRRAIVTYLES